MSRLGNRIIPFLSPSLPSKIRNALCYYYLLQVFVTFVLIPAHSSFMLTFEAITRPSLSHSFSGKKLGLTNFVLKFKFEFIPPCL